MIKNNKIFFRTYDAFQSALQSGQISGDSIVFIENRGLVWTHGAFFGDVTDDLVNYCLKSETYTKAEVQALIDTVEKFTYRIASELPTASADTMYIIYLVPSNGSTAQNIKDEYITIDNGEEAETRYTWEQIGSTAVNMSGYYTGQQTEAAISAALADYTPTSSLLSLIAANKAALGLNNVGNFKAVSTEANQNLIDAEKSNAQLNMGLPYIVDVREDGFYLIDEYGYIGAQLTEDGFDAIGLENVGSGSTITITNY